MSCTYCSSEVAEVPDADLLDYVNDLEAGRRLCERYQEPRLLDVIPWRDSGYGRFWNL